MDWRPQGFREISFFSCRAVGSADRPALRQRATETIPKPVRFDLKKKKKEFPGIGKRHERVLQKPSCDPYGKSEGGETMSYPSILEPLRGGALLT